MLYTLGPEVVGWTVPRCPDDQPIIGPRVVLRRLNRDDASALFDVFAPRDNRHDWLYVPFEPFAEVAELRHWFADVETSDDPRFYTMCSKTDGRPFGFCSYLNIKPEAGSIEVGFVQIAPAFQRTTLLTEAMYLMAEHVFGLGYRRYEWKCDALNIRSRRAAHRLGFTYEGTFLQALVVKGRNRDTKWFSILDRDWADLRRVYKAWLSPENFDAAGHQKRSLSKMTAPFVAAFDPDLGQRPS